MTSIHGTDPSRDYTHMYNIKDLRALPAPAPRPDCVLGVLATDPEVQDFYKLLKDNPRAGLLNDPQSECSIFVPLDVGGVTTFNTDPYTISKLLDYHTTPRFVEPGLLRGSPAFLLSTRLGGEKIFVENLSGPSSPARTLLNSGASEILAYQQVGKSNIYFISKMLPKFNIHL